MKMLKIILGLTIVHLANVIKAENIFPVFSEKPMSIAIPMTTQYYRHDPQFEVGSNAVYLLTGQIFTNATEGHIQTTAGGFDGTTDRSTPWKTLTELLAAYQQGGDEKKIRSLYTAASKEFLDEIYSSPDVTARFKKFISSTTGMQAVMGFNFENGYVAIMTLSNSSGPNQLMPFYLVKTNGAYLLSTFKSNSIMQQNLGVFLNKHSVAELLK